MNLFGWKGRYGVVYDAETGWFWMHHRHYSPQLGRFIKRDPIGFRGGINLYGYCGDDPVNFADPSGLVNWGEDYGRDTLPDEYSYGKHAFLCIANAVKDTVYPPAVWANLSGSADNFGTVTGLYDAGKASAGDVAIAGALCAWEVGSTATGGYASVKSGMRAITRYRPHHMRSRFQRGFVDLTGHRSDHILNRHRNGAGKSQKTEFPADWTDEMILDYISDVATDPNATWGMGQWNSPYVTGTREGIDIRVDYYPNGHANYDGKISTGYPTNTPMNP